MAGIRDLLPSMAQLLASQYTITSPTTSLSDVRILGSTDATFGTVGWVPELNGRPFAVIDPTGVSDATPEPNRVWATYHVSIFVGVEHADTPSVNENYNDLAMAWLDQARQVVASNRRILPNSASLFPTAGDVRWEFRGGSVKPDYPVFGVRYYGVLLHTTVMLAILVNYEF